MIDNSQPHFSRPATSERLVRRLPYLARPLTRQGRLGHRGAVRLSPFLDLVLTWNTGISYGWFQQEGPLGQWVLLVLKMLAVALLWIWSGRAIAGLVRLSLGLAKGGAIGNALDRLAYGAVADFVF